ncbi:MAG: NADH-quinone oxidoreductase subunit C [Firmicutes bacterium]|nr:NADH-quinone oxidoreductase subunit C [Bacillota bacterium]
MTQEILDVGKAELLGKTADLKNTGFRLAQICAVRAENGLVLLYSFIKGCEFVSLRFPVAAAEPVESVSWLYPYAFLYENEMKDLFGANITNINLDFGGHFYETALRTPFMAE